ncbi:MAG: ABC transporter ATP-binding protein/permease [Paracholeplasma sp.]|nr:ABC transporter ATP-binding protein/permease [Paracholeplasma sp.]MDY3195763.1 ABC transporter ATP-binding protein/permease [Paracholeplasma sp.]
MIRLEGISKYYTTDANVVMGLRKVNLELKIGEFVAITGESGSGKSTLLNVISGLDKYDDGEMYVLGEETSYYSTDELEQYRKLYIGFVFQNYNIIDSYTVLENVMIALALQGYPKEKRKSRALELIDKVGLSSHVNHRSSKLSGGQKQRAVIARALAKDCPIIVADEPTGNLDQQSGEMIMALLKEIAKEKLVVVVTHNYEQVAPYATRKIRMYDGEIVEDKELKSVEIKEERAPIAHYQMNIIDLLRFSLKNMYRIPKKSMILLLFTMVSILSVFLVYSNYQRSNSENTYYGYNSVFTNLHPGRLVVKKRDETPFTLSEINRFESMNRVLSVSNYDLVNDLSISLFNEDYGRQINPRSLVYFDDAWLVRGRLPQNENEVLLRDWDGSGLGIDFELYLDGKNTSVDGYKLTVVGYYRDDLYLYGGSGEIGFFHEDFFNGPKDDFSQMPRIMTLFMMTNQITVHQENNAKDNVIFKSYYYLNSQVPFNEIRMQIDLAQYIASQLGLDVFSPFESLTGLSVTSILPYEAGTINNVTFKETTLSSSSFELIEMSLDTAQALFYQAPYQITLNTEDKFDAKLVLDSISSDYYVVYPAGASESSFANVLTIGLLFIMLIVLGFVYIALNLVQKNVINSRKKDFIIFRSIGASRRDLVSILYIEQVFYVLFGFIFSYVAGFLIQLQFKNVVIFKYIIPQMHFWFIVIFVGIGLMMARKFSVKLFGKSVITTLKSEN